jgi:hypothetical protein
MKLIGLTLRFDGKPQLSVVDAATARQAPL